MLIFLAPSGVHTFRVRELLEQTLQLWLCELTRTAQPLHLRESPLERFGFDRLQEVVDRVHGERLQRILIEGGGKNHEGLDGQSRQDLDPSHFAKYARPSVESLAADSIRQAMNVRSCTQYTAAIVAGK